MPGVEALRLRGSGAGLHAVAAGPRDGPLVVLLHGFPEFWRGWRRQIGPLAAAGLRVVAPDQRGYDLSDKPGGVRAYALDTLAYNAPGMTSACPEVVRGASAALMFSDRPRLWQGVQQPIRRGR
jgi:pimeloyl-ACP methyl ester carboxylesterase